MSMNLDYYQSEARKTAIYPGKLMYPALGLCGEVGELTDACRNEDGIQKEIGDVIWYIANVASDANLLLSDVIEKTTFKFKKKFPGWDQMEACEESWVAASVVAENVKKAFRDNNGVLTEARQEKVRKALQRLVLALSRIAYYYEVSLNECAKMNLDKLRSRQERGKLQGDGDNR